MLGAIVGILLARFKSLILCGLDFPLFTPCLYTDDSVLRLLG
jgi:hypothetical protein